MSESPGKDLIDRLTKAIAESEQALTDLSQAHEHATRAADAFEATVPGTNIQDAADAAHQSRATTEAILPLAAELSTAIDTLRAYLNRLTGGASAPAATTSTQPVSGGELLERPSRRSRMGQLSDLTVEHLDDLSEQSGKMAGFIQRGLHLQAPELVPPSAAYTGTGQPAFEPLADRPQAADPGTADTVSSLTVVAVVAIKGGERLVNLWVEKLKEWKHDHGR